MAAAAAAKGWQPQESGSHACQSVHCSDSRSSTTSTRQNIKVATALAIVDWSKDALGNHFLGCTVGQACEMGQLSSGFLKRQGLSEYEYRSLNLHQIRTACTVPGPRRGIV
mmetsp:Transcript_121403/g.234194  ORF Transcript_121403/g.234194 Transcript_121403/m.234194 type:complete len:111 (-) Transcript_121403:99-431(-)